MGFVWLNILGFFLQEVEDTEEAVMTTEAVAMVDPEITTVAGQSYSR